METFKITRILLEGAMNYRHVEIISCADIACAEKHFFTVVTDRLKQLVPEGVNLNMGNQFAVFLLENGTSETWFLNEVTQLDKFDWDLYEAQQR